VKSPGYSSYDRAPPPHFRIAHRIRKKATTNGDNQKSAAAMRVSHPPCRSVANMTRFYAQITVVGEIAWLLQLTMDKSPDNFRRDELDQPDESQNRTCRNDPDFQHLFPVERKSL
jgi:hypothetical protein